MLDLCPATKIRVQEFVIGLDATERIAGTRMIAVGSVAVHLFEGARATRLVDGDDRCIGLFIGDVIDYQAGQLRIGDIRLKRANSSTGELESFVYSHAGRWVFVYTDGDRHRIYLDANGSHSVVYDPDSRRAASTTGLLLDDDQYHRRFDSEMYRSLGVDHDGWFPSGLTAHHGISRLLCNHFLDLSTWRTIRHWPTTDFCVANDAAEHARRITSLTRATAETIVQSSTAAVSLTAGNESRFLLAAFRPFIDRLQFVTIDAPGAKLDVQHAKTLAERHGLRHSVLSIRNATPEQRRTWQYRSSHCIGGNNMRHHPSIEPLASYDYFLGGLGGEIGRAFFWRDGDSQRTELNGRAVAARLGMPHHERVVDATNDWFESVSSFNALTQLDLAYLELRMSAWAFAQSHAQDAIVAHIHPMISREIYQLMLELPADVKRESRFIVDGIRSAWPELLRLPINKYGDHRDLVALLRKVTSPKRVVRKVRRTLG